MHYYSVLRPALDDRDIYAPYSYNSGLSLSPSSSVTVLTIVLDHRTCHQPCAGLFLLRITLEREVPMMMGITSVRSKACVCIVALP